MPGTSPGPIGPVTVAAGETIHGKRRHARRHSAALRPVRGPVTMRATLRCALLGLAAWACSPPAAAAAMATAAAAPLNITATSLDDGVVGVAYTDTVSGGRSGARTRSAPAPAPSRRPRAEFGGRDLRNSLGPPGHFELHGQVIDSAATPRTTPRRSRSTSSDPLADRRPRHSADTTDRRRLRGDHRRDRRHAAATASRYRWRAAGRALARR